MFYGYLWGLTNFVCILHFAAIINIHNCATYGCTSTTTTTIRQTYVGINMQHLYFNKHLGNCKWVGNEWMNESKLQGVSWNTKWNLIKLNTSSNFLWKIAKYNKISHKN